MDPGPDGVTRTCDPDYPSFAVSFCKAVQGAVDAASGAVDAAASAVAFASDPIGWLNQRLAEGATGVFEWIATTANTATMPDLTSDWWISAYKKGFAAGIVIFFMVLMWQFVQLGRGKISQSEMLDALVARTPAFFAGMVFGPPLAQFMIVGAGQLTDDIVTGMTGSTGEATEAINAAIASAGAGNIVGGAVVALLILLVLIVACLFIFIALCTQTVAIYISSAVFGIAFAWIADAKRTSGSMRIPLIFLGLVFSRPLLFFVLSVGMGMVKGGFSGEADGAAKQLGTLVMAVVLLSMVALSPMLLLQLAPVLPTGGDSSSAGGASGGDGSRGSGGAGGGSVSTAGAASGGGSGGGSAMQQLARPSASPAPAMAGASGGGSPGGGRSAASGGGSGSGATAGSGSGQSSGTAAAAKPNGGQPRASGGGSGSGSGQPLGRTRRHGGGSPSPAAAAMLAGSRSSSGGGGGASGGGASSKLGALGSAARAGAHKAQKPMADTARGMEGGKPW